MKYKLLIVLFVIFPVITYCQSIYYSKYGYTIEIPTNFTQKEAIGKNVDLNISDNLGNAFVIVVKKVIPENSINSAYELTQITYQEWENALAEGLPNPKVVKSGKTYLDNKEAFYLHYTITDYDNSLVSYFINYQVIHNNYLYTLTATCPNSMLSKQMPVFYFIG